MKNINKQAGKNKLLLVTSDKGSKPTNKDLEDKFNEFTNLLIKVDLHGEEAVSYLHRLHNILKNEVELIDTKQTQKVQFLTSKSPYKSFFQSSLLVELITLLISILLITIGLALIVIPAPSDSFEIATIFYFNPQDGVTIMDLIALLIIFSGIYLFIRTVIREKH